MIFDIGIDIVDVNDLSIKLKRTPNLIDKIYTEKEKLYCKNNIQRLAGKFAAKEAFLKSIKNFKIPIEWNKIEILNKENGQPFINTSKIKNIKEVKISISHTKNQAISQIITIFK